MEDDTKNSLEIYHPNPNLALPNAGKSSSPLLCSSFVLFCVALSADRPGFPVGSSSFNFPGGSRDFRLSFDFHSAFILVHLRYMFLVTRLFFCLCFPLDSTCSPSKLSNVRSLTLNGSVHSPR